VFVSASRVHHQKCKTYEKEEQSDKERRKMNKNAVEEEEVAQNIVVEWLGFCFVFWRSRVQISTQRPVIQTDVFRGFTQSLQSGSVLH
jgi:hypothetical protein